MSGATLVLFFPSSLSFYHNSHGNGEVRSPSSGAEGCRGWHFQTDLMPDLKLQPGALWRLQGAGCQMENSAEAHARSGKRDVSMQLLIRKVKCIKMGCFFLLKGSVLMLLIRNKSRKILKSFM